MSDLWHLAERAEWEKALATGSYERSTRGLGLAQVGFVHCSYPHQLAGVAAAFYADATDLVLLRIDPAEVPAEIRVEEGFPHGYGPIPVAAVTATPVGRDAAGHLPLPGDDPRQNVSHNCLAARIDAQTTTGRPHPPPVMRHVLEAELPGRGPGALDAVGDLLERDVPGVVRRSV